LVECVTGDVLNDLVSVLTGVNGTVEDKLFDSDDSESAVVSTSTTTSSGDVDESDPLSLLELSTRAVAKHCSCASLEKHSPPLDEGLLRRVCSLCCIYVLHCFNVLLVG